MTFRSRSDDFAWPLFRTAPDYTLLVLSPAYLADRWAQFSASLASHARVETQQNRLLPLMRSVCVPPQRINCLVHLDCTGEDPLRWTAEIARVRALLDRPEQAEERIPCPYTGPQAAPVMPAPWRSSAMPATFRNVITRRVCA